MIKLVERKKVIQEKIDSLNNEINDLRMEVDDLLDELDDVMEKCKEKEKEFTDKMFQTFDCEYVYTINEIDLDLDRILLTILTPELETITTKIYSASYFLDQIKEGMIVPYEK